jgi:hypothetical protein
LHFGISILHQSTDSIAFKSLHLPDMSVSPPPTHNVNSSITIADTVVSRSPYLKRRGGPPSSGTSTRTGDLLMDSVDNEPTWPREWRAYTALMGCFFLMFNSWGLVNAYGTFATYYKEQLLPGRDLYLFNLIGSTESFIVLIFSFMIGRLLDAGLSKIVLPTGFFLVTLGMFMLSLSSGGGSTNSGNYGIIWVTQGFTTGLGMACFFVASSQSTFDNLSLHTTRKAKKCSCCYLVRKTQVVRHRYRGFRCKHR